MRYTKKALVAVVGDFHINSTTALSRPRFNLDDGGYYVASKLQKAIYSHFMAYVDAVRAAKESNPSRPLYAILNGEISDDLRHPSTQMISRNPHDCTRNAIETIMPLVELADKLIVTRGTEAHSGLSSWSDEMIAADLGAIPNETGQHAHGVFEGVIGGVRFRVQHHGYSSSNNRHLMTSAANRNAQRIMQNYARIGKPYPDLVLFGHHHKPFDSEDLYHMRVMCLPSWQLTNSYGYRLGGDWLPVGGIIVECDNGKYEIEKHYTYLEGGRWRNV